MTPRLAPQRVRDARDEAGLTQRSAGASVGVSKQTIANIESGRHTPSADLAARLAALYGVTLDSLFTHAVEVDTSSNGDGKVETVA